MRKTGLGTRCLGQTLKASTFLQSRVLHGWRPVKGAWMCTSIAPSLSCAFVVDSLKGEINGECDKTIYSEY